MEKIAKIHYLLSEAGRKQSLLQGGDGKEEQTVETPATPEVLELATVDKDGNVIIQIGTSTWTVTGYKVNKSPYHHQQPYIEKITSKKLFDIPQTAEQLIAWERNRRATVAHQEKDLQPELIEAVAEWKEAVVKREADEDARRNARKRGEEEREAKKAAAKTKYEADRAAWIAENGSEYLKQGLKLDYNVNRTYVDDRATLEYPGFQVARGDNWEWKEKINPSPEALIEVAALIEAGVEAEIVWLQGTPEDRDEDGYSEPFEATEAIMIHGYLGKYDLIKY